MADARDPVWTESVAVGSLDYTLKMRRALALSNPGREPVPEEDGWSLREEGARYRVRRLIAAGRDGMLPVSARPALGVGAAR